MEFFNNIDPLLTVTSVCFREGKYACTENTTATPAVSSCATTRHSADLIAAKLTPRLIRSSVWLAEQRRRILQSRLHIGWKYVCYVDFQIIDMPAGIVRRHPFID